MKHDSALDALEQAIKRGDVVAVRHWLADGGDIHACDYHHRSPLAMAATAGHTPIIRLLLDAGADVNERWPDWSTPLVLAAMSGSAKAVALLLRRGAKADVDGKPVSDMLRGFGYAHEEHILRLLDDAYFEPGPTGGLDEEAG
jgi:ankyrin repeat protein